MKTLAVIDIETRNWNEFLGLGYYDGESYIFFDSIDKFLTYCKDNLSDVIIYAHNGGRFDFLFLLDVIMPYGKPQKYKVTDFLLIHSSINSFRFFGVEFRDSLAIMPGSLRKLASYFGTEKLSIDYNKIESEDWRGYLKQDCLALYHVLKKYFDYLQSDLNCPTISKTIASTAMSLYKANFNKLPYWKSYHDSLIREAYQGGRCEIFKFSGKNVNCYDINSMYPFVMAYRLYPIGRPFFAKSKQRLESDFLGFISATVECPNLYIPILPIRYRGKLMFFDGKISGTWTLSEFRFALEHNYKIHSINWVLYYDKSEDIFSDYINTLYSKRVSTKNESEKYILKLLLNSLYGKFGTNPQKEEIIFAEEFEKLSRSENSQSILRKIKPVSIERGIFAKDKILEADYIIPAIAAHVTSYARMELYKYLKSDTLYCDTDSVFTPSVLPVSPGLGFLKLEERCKHVDFFAPKLYRTDSKIKAKGFNLPKSESEKDDIFERIIGKEEIESERILSFKQSLRSHLPFASKRLDKKSVKSDYDKRKKIGSNETEPWTIEEYERVKEH